MEIKKEFIIRVESNEEEERLKKLLTHNCFHYVVKEKQ